MCRTPFAVTGDGVERDGREIGQVGEEGPVGDVLAEGDPVDLLEACHHVRRPGAKATISLRKLVADTVSVTPTVRVACSRRAVWARVVSADDSTERDVEGDDVLGPDHESRWVPAVDRRDLVGGGQLGAGRPTAGLDLGLAQAPDTSPLDGRHPHGRHRAPAVGGRAPQRATAPTTARAVAAATTVAARRDGASARRRDGAGRERRRTTTRPTAVATPPRPAPPSHTSPDEEQGPPEPGRAGQRSAGLAEGDPSQGEAPEGPARAQGLGQDHGAGQGGEPDRGRAGHTAQARARARASDHHEDHAAVDVEGESPTTGRARTAPGRPPSRRGGAGARADRRAATTAGRPPVRPGSRTPTEEATGRVRPRPPRRAPPPVPAAAPSRPAPPAPRRRRCGPGARSTSGD